MMNQSILSRFPLLREATLEVLEEIEYSEIILHTPAKLSENRQEIAEIVLVDEIIMIYVMEQGHSVPAAYVRLDDSVKVERIFQRKGIFGRQLKGFKLRNCFHEEIAFLLDSTQSASLWMQNLSNLLNETQFHNNYRPIRILGRGGSATVYEIARLDDGRRFATKVIDKAFLRNNGLHMHNFQNQLEILRSVDHKNLLKIKGTYESESSFYLVMEALKGGNLSQYLRRMKGDLTFRQIQRIMISLLNGLSYLEEEGIVHRDIKLENLMLRKRHRLEAVIVDFGLAVYQEDEDYHTYQCGTPGYISPEIITLKKGEKLHPKSDIFSAGAVLHFLLTKKCLFAGSNLEEVMRNNLMMNFNLEGETYSQVNSLFMDLLKLMLQLDPKKRPSASQCLKHISLQPIEGEKEQLALMSPFETTLELQI